MTWNAWASAITVGACFGIGVALAVIGYLPAAACCVGFGLIVGATWFDDRRDERARNDMPTFWGGD